MVARVSQEKADLETTDRFPDSLAPRDLSTSLRGRSPRTCVCACQAGGPRQTFRSQRLCLALRQRSPLAQTHKTEPHRRMQTFISECLDFLRGEKSPLVIEVCARRCAERVGSTLNPTGEESSRPRRRVTPPPPPPTSSQSLFLEIYHLKRWK